MARLLPRELRHAESSVSASGAKLTARKSTQYAVGESDAGDEGSKIRKEVRLTRSELWRAEALAARAESMDRRAYRRADVLGSDTIAGNWRERVRQHLWIAC
jgi:hypothetical protein